MRSALSFEHLRPGLKALGLVGSVALEAVQNLFNGFFFGLLAVVSVLGKEIVGVTDQLFFDGNGQHVVGGQRQIKLMDIIRADSNPHMTFADETVCRHAAAIQHFTAQDAVADIGLLAIAAQPRAVRLQDADIMQHGGIFDEIKVRLEMGDLFGSQMGFLCDLLSMLNEYFKCFRAPVVIFCKDLCGSHDLISYLGSRIGLVFTA
jgi:hypothetical protein